MKQHDELYGLELCTQMKSIAKINDRAWWFIDNERETVWEVTDSGEVEGLMERIGTA